MPPIPEFVTYPKLAAFTSDGRTVQLWDFTTARVRLTLKGHFDLVNAVAFSPDGRLVATASDDETAMVWSSKTGRAILTLRHKETVAFPFHPDSKLVSYADDSDSSDDDELFRLSAKGKHRDRFQNVKCRVWDVAFSPDGRVVASASCFTVTLWNSATGAVLHTLNAHTGTVRAVAFSPDGTLVASVSHDKTVRLWGSVMGVLLSTLYGHSRRIYAVVFSPNGRLVASASKDKTVKLWSSAVGILYRTLEGHSSAVRAVAFSPNGRLIASASEDQTVRLWDSVTGLARMIFVGHSDSVYAVVFSPDGRLVASASKDRSVILWDSATGAVYRTFKVHSGTVRSLAFSLNIRKLKEQWTRERGNTATDVAKIPFSLERAGVASQTSIPPAPSAPLVIVRSMIERARTSIQRWLRPEIPYGYRRIEWTCTCGKILYGDLKETALGSLDDLAAKLSQLNQRSGYAQIQNTHTNSSSSSPTVTRPSSIHMRSSRQVEWSHPDVDNNNIPTPTNQLTVRKLAFQKQWKMYLELCITSGKFAHNLGEVEVRNGESDGVLFRKIRETYEGTRKSLLPVRYCLRRPVAAIFVKLRMDDRPYVSPIAGTLLAPSIPPKEEVDNGRYEYHPCPIDEPPMTSNWFMHHFDFIDDSKHPMEIWGPRLPKKLHISLSASTGQLAKGWGIRIEEGPNWALISILMFSFVLISGLVAWAYAAKTHDNQTAVAIGSWLTTVQTMALTTFFFWGR